MDLMNQDHNVALQTSEHDMQSEILSSTQPSTSDLQRQHHSQWSTAMSIDPNTNVSLFELESPRTTWAPFSGARESPSTTQLHTRSDSSSSTVTSEIFLEHTIYPSASPHYDTNSTQCNQFPVTPSSSQESESSLGTTQSDATVISNEGEEDGRSDPLKDIPKSDRSIATQEGFDKIRFGNVNGSSRSSAFTFVNYHHRTTPFPRPISRRATRPAATLRPVIQRPLLTDMPPIICSPDSSRPNSPIGETRMLSTSSTATASQTLVEMIQTMPSSGLLPAVSQDLRERYLACSQEIGEITKNFDPERFLPRDGLSLYSPLPNQGVPPNQPEASTSTSGSRNSNCSPPRRISDDRATRRFKRLPRRECYIVLDVPLVKDGETKESDAPANRGIDKAKHEGRNVDRSLNWPTRRVKRLPARECYIVPDVPSMSEEETTESDALADSDIDAPPPRQRRRHSPSENGSFDAAKSEGGNFDADIDNHLPSAAADLAEMIEFMKMPLGSISASASSQQPEQGAVAQADDLGAIDASQSVTPGASEGSELVDDTDEEVSEVSLGSSEDEGTYSYQATGNSNLCLIADIQSESSGAMDGDSPATYTGIHGENNCGEIDPNVVLDSGHAAHGTSTWNLPSAEGPFDFGDGYEGHSILAEEGECSQQRPNYFSSRTVSNYSSLSGVFGDTELPSQYDEEMFSTAEPIDTSFSGNPDNADYQQYPTSSNFDAPSSRNGGQDSVNYEYHQSYTDAVEELCTFLALSRLSLSDAGSGQNWTPSPSSANPDISHLAADARETEFVQRSDNLPSEMQVNEEVERSMNSEVVSTVDDDANDSEAAMAEDMDTVTDHNAAAVYPEVDWTAATQVPPMAEHTPLLNLAMDIGPEIIAMGEDWSTDLAATLSRDDRPSQFLVPYAWLLPSAMRVSQGLTDEDDLDGSDQPMPMAEADGEDDGPSQTGAWTQGTFMDALTLSVTLGISRLSIIEHAPPAVSSEMSGPSISTFHSAHNSVNANLDAVPFDNFNPTRDNESQSEHEVVQSLNLESDGEIQHELIAHGSSEGTYAPPEPLVLTVEASTTEVDTESLTPVPDSGRAAVGVPKVQETTTPSNTFNDELDDVARGVLQGLDLADLQQASTEEEVAIVSGDSQQINDVPLDHQFLTLDFQVSWDVELDLPINAGVASDSNDGQQHIPAASIWSRRPHSIQGDINIPAVICGLYGEGVVVQARRIRGFLHPYRSDGRIHKSFAERRRRIAGFDVSQAARAAGRADIDTDEKTIKRKKKPSDNDTNNLGVPDGIVGNVIADVRLGEAFEPPHAVDDVANFKTDAVVDQKSPKDPKGINVNAKSHLRAEQSPKSRGEDTSVSSATDPLVFPAVAPVLIAMPLLVAPVIIPPVEIPHEEPLAIPGAWPDPVPIHAPPGRAPRRPLWDIFADWFDDTWEALFEPVVE